MNRVVNPQVPAVKKAKVSEDDETTILRKIDGIQTEIDHINEDASEEILLIEEKYNGLRKPCYDRRGELIRNVKSFWVTAVSYTCLFANFFSLQTVPDG